MDLLPSIIPETARQGPKSSPETSAIQNPSRRHLHFQSLNIGEKLQLSTYPTKYTSNAPPISRPCDLEPRAAAARDTALEQPRRSEAADTQDSTTDLHQRSFEPKYSRLWNAMTQQILRTACPACKLSRLMYTDGGPTIPVNN